MAVAGLEANPLVELATHTIMGINDYLTHVTARPAPNGKFGVAEALQCATFNVSLGSRAAVKMACRPRPVYLPLLKVGAPRAALAAHPQLPDQPER